MSPFGSISPGGGSSAFSKVTWTRHGHTQLDSRPQYFAGLSRLLLCQKHDPVLLLLSDLRSAGLLHLWLWGLLCGDRELRTHYSLEICKRRLSPVNNLTKTGHLFGELDKLQIDSAPLGQALLMLCFSRFKKRNNIPNKFKFLSQMYERPCLEDKCRPEREYNKIIKYIKTLKYFPIVDLNTRLAGFS